MNNPHLISAKTVQQELMQDEELCQLWEQDTAQRAVRQAIIGERIAQRLTQKQLAARANMKRESVARVESGGSSPTLSTLTKIARALGKQLEVRFS